MKYNFSKKRNDYMTPPELIDNLLKEIGIDKFDLDVCCSQINIPAFHHCLDGVKDGLASHWLKLNWMNPPFDVCDKWVKKAVKEQEKGNTTYSLIPVRTETKFWHDHILFNPNVEIRYLRKGLCFIDPETSKPVQMEVTHKKTGEKRLVDGVYKNALAIVVFKGHKGATEQLPLTQYSKADIFDEYF
ncbi:MAG: DNA N-6-adenine-methyltransferase [Candidatus Gastranaerophilaceae bacterium]